MRMRERVRHTFVTRLASHDLVTVSDSSSRLGKGGWVTVGLYSIVHLQDYTGIGYRDESGIAARNLVSRLLHSLELCFCDNISIRLFHNFFAQGQYARPIETNQGDANTTTKEGV